jgi:hypothetical protein
VQCGGLVTVQQQPGQKRIFWIDAPGVDYYLEAPPGEWIYSMTESGQFTSKVCNRFLNCTPVNWSLTIVVDPGSNLDFGASSASIDP